jgi:Spy/CpxP family protein refolding chaperone
MTARLLQVLLGLSLLLNTFVLAGFVYRSWIDPPPPFEGRMHPPPPPPQAGPRPSPVEMLAHELDLDDGQRQALRELFEKYAAARRERLQEIQKVREQTAAEIRQPQLDIPKIEALVDQVSHLRTEQQKESMRTIAELEPQLRPEQRERMKTILSERFSSPPMSRLRTQGTPAAGGPPPPPGGPPRPPQ